MSENDAANQPEDDSPTGSPRSWPKTLLRLWMLRRVEAAPGGSSVAAASILSLCSLGLWICIDWWERQPDPMLSADGVPVLAWYALGALALAALLRSRLAARPRLAAMVVLVAALSPFPLGLAVFAAYGQGAGVWFAGALVSLYSLAFLARGLRMFTGRRQWGAATLGLLFLLGFGVASDVSNAIPDLWNPGDSAVGPSDEQLAEREAALFEQSDRIDQALDDVHRGPGKGPKGFFLGFAGVGDESVFAQEIGLASRVIGERYGTGERELSLINDERDLDSAPLASVSGLSYALQGLASVMQLDRDVLFLSISSHGSPDPSIAVANSQFPLTDLTPEDLADALRDAGIQWRVIIISACYAGGFIDALRDAHTMIITAAAADRTSFGCSSDRDLTYFGEAFYRDALPGASSLRDAFEKAKKAVSERERAEGITASDPQAYFGVDIESYLAQLGAADSNVSNLPQQTL